MVRQGWIKEESVIALYFIARQALFSGEVAETLIKLRCGRDRSAAACRSHVAKLRKSMSKDPYNEHTDTYDLDIVDTWLSSQFTTKAELEALLGLKDNKIVDEKVREKMGGSRVRV